MGAHAFRTLWSPPGAFSFLFFFINFFCEHSLKISSTKPSWVCEWVRTHLLIWMCVCVSERELTSLPPFRPIKRRTNLANRISNERTDRRTDTHRNPKPKRIPITLSDTLTLSDTDTLSDFSSHWEFSQPTQEFIHDIEGPWFLHKQTGHWVIPITLRDTPNTELYPLPWVPANRIPLTLSYTHYPVFQPIEYRTDGQTRLLEHRRTHTMFVIIYKIRTQCLMMMMWHAMCQQNVRPSNQPHDSWHWFHQIAFID